MKYLDSKYIIYKNAAIDLFLSRDYQKSLDIFKKLLGTEPNNVEVLTFISHCYSGMKNHVEALLYVRKALEINPSYIFALHLKGLIYGDIGRVDEAIEILESVIGTGYKDDEILCHLGELYQKKGDLRNAVHAYLQAYKLIEFMEPDAIFNNLANCLSGLGEFTEAIEIYDKLLELNPNDVAPIYNKAIAYKRMGDESIYIQQTG